MSTTSLSIPDDLRQDLRRHGQEHVLAWWNDLDDAGRRTLLDQLRCLDLDLLQRLYAERGRAFQVPSPERIAPAPVIPRNSPDNAARRRLGEECLCRGEVAVLLVAGGQGSRLGFEQPKGMFPVGPISNKSLFQVHAEKVLALSRRHGCRLPFLVMTSPATHAPTQEFFAEHRSFGLAPEAVQFFCQGTMPALDLATGRLLLEDRGRLFLSPDGHGGTLTALAASGLLERLKQQGIRQVFYFQVDNPLVKVADPTFLGHHLAHRAEVSSKVVAKEGPKERMGVIASVDGRCTIIEYSDLPDELAQQTDANGRLRLWAGSPAIHWFDLDFLDRVTRNPQGMPFHVARKKVNCLDEAGRVVQPEKENALKFERFVFDVLPLADRWTVVETTRREEFAPLKNATGPDSPETVAHALSNQAADWLAAAGVTVPRDSGGNAAFPLEVSPLFALDAEEFAARVDRELRQTGMSAPRRIDGPRYFQEG
jgi:UDP-N-acetylglucosamine/UDP-N-acetylgalactosamine diphosphorylase